MNFKLFTSELLTNTFVKHVVFYVISTVWLKDNLKLYQNCLYNNNYYVKKYQFCIIMIVILNEILYK